MRVDGTCPGLARGQHPPRGPSWCGSQCQQGFTGTCRPCGLNPAVQEGCGPRCNRGSGLAGCRQAVTHNGPIFPHTPGERGRPRRPEPLMLAAHRACAHTDCFGLFSRRSRPCRLLPPQANHFAKLPRYTNFVWRLTSLADGFCRHPSPELISLPVLQS